MGNLASVNTVDASASNTNVNWAGSAIAMLEANNAPRPYVYVSGTALFRNLRQVKAGATTVDSPLFPVGSEDAPTIWGARGYMAAGLAAGTVYCYSPSSCFIVNRTSQFDIQIDRSRLFNSDESEMRLKARLDFFFPYTGAICRGTGIVQRLGVGHARRGDATGWGGLAFSPALGLARFLSDADRETADQALCQKC